MRSVQKKAHCVTLFALLLVWCRPDWGFDDAAIRHGPRVGQELQKVCCGICKR